MKRLPPLAPFMARIASLLLIGLMLAVPATPRHRALAAATGRLAAVAYTSAHVAPLAAVVTPSAMPSVTGAAARAIAPLGADPVQAGRPWLAAPSIQAVGRNGPVVGSYARAAEVAALRLRATPTYTGTVTLLMPLGAIVHVLSGPFNKAWYRVSYRGISGYADGSYLVETGLAGRAIARAAPYTATQLVVVSLARQQLEAYQSGRLILITAVTTGHHDLSTPSGTYRVLAKYSPLQMISPWPPGSPYWYAPSWVSYAIQFTTSGHFLHDAPWRPYYGYGTDAEHLDPDGVWRQGSHGCVNLPLWSARALYAWIRIGSTVRIVSW